jgi:hypothetical protein
VTLPNRDLELDVEDAAPVASANANDNDAPYGRKKDGTPMKRRGRPAGSTNASSGGTRSPRRTSGSLENQIGGLLFTINAPFQLFLSNDALDVVEVQALAHALDQEAQRNARFRKYVESALAVQGGTSLALVIAAIVGRRVVRHNLITVPAPIGNMGADAALGGIISMTTGKGPINPNLFAMPDKAAETTAG